MVPTYCKLRESNKDFLLYTQTPGIRIQCITAVSKLVSKAAGSFPSQRGLTEITWRRDDIIALLLRCEWIKAAALGASCKPTAFFIVLSLPETKYLSLGSCRVVIILEAVLNFRFFKHFLLQCLFNKQVSGVVCWAYFISFYRFSCTTLVCWL